MNKIAFTLKNPKSAKDTAIIMLYSCKDGRLKYYTGESIQPSLWPASVSRGTRAVLSRIETAVHEAITDYKIKGEPLTKAILRDRLDKVLNRTRPEPELDFFIQADQLIEKMKYGDLLTWEKKRYAPSTIRKLEFTVSVLNRFDPKMTVKNVTIETYDRFIVYCQKQGMAVNYMGALIKNWKILGKLIGGNPVFESQQFRKLREETPDVSLDEKEIQALMDLELDRRQAVTRDWFIIGCFTGLRVSDLFQLSKHNFAKGFITIANQKTDEKVVLPVHPLVAAIIDKYKGVPPKISDIEFNRTIKKVAEKAGITGNVLYTVTKGGKRVDYYLKKFEMVSSHTMRRSFITNARKTGIPDAIVMKLTGIRSPKTLVRYDKISPEEAATIAAGLAFYK